MSHIIRPRAQTRAILADLTNRCHLTDAELATVDMILLKKNKDWTAEEFFTCHDFVGHIGLRSGE